MLQDSDPAKMETSLLPAGPWTQGPKMPRRKPSLTLLTLEQSRVRGHFKIHLQPLTLHSALCIRGFNQPWLGNGILKDESKSSCLGPRDPLGLCRWAGDLAVECFPTPASVLPLISVMVSSPLMSGSMDPRSVLCPSSQPPRPHRPHRLDPLLLFGSPHIASFSLLPRFTCTSPSGRHQANYDSDVSDQSQTAGS